MAPSGNHWDCEQEDRSQDQPEVIIFPTVNLDLGMEVRSSGLLRNLGRTPSMGCFPSHVTDWNLWPELCYVQVLEGIDPGAQCIYLGNTDVHMSFLLA